MKMYKYSMMRRIAVPAAVLFIMAGWLGFSGGQPVTTAFADTGAAAVNGGAIYNGGCNICHQAGLNAAPKYGNKILWGKVVQKGRDTVYQNAINGIRGMPPRGGQATLTDEQVKAAVDYMVESSGGWKD